MAEVSGEDQPERPSVSIVIATFNSARTLSRVLDAVRLQSVDAGIVEVLLIDGGSSDETSRIGTSFGAKIVPNPRTEPVYAKYLGLKESAGKYVLYLDHDEVLASPESIRDKLRLFAEFPQLRASVSSGYINPPGYPVINRYINDYGDPFSFFVYRLSKDVRTFYPQMVSTYDVAHESGTGVVVSMRDVKNLPLIELCACGAIIDGEFFKRELAIELESPSAIPHLFYLLQTKSNYLGITRNDGLIHYSSDTLSAFLNKIKWRVKNNIHHQETMGKAGFSGRVRYSSHVARVRKLMFLPYCFSIIGPVVDATWLVIKKRDWLYFIHVPLALYTAGQILWQASLKFIGLRPKLRSYDESKVLSDPRL